jgi:hypothetical protein
VTCWAWLVELNGLPVDIRSMPPEVRPERGAEAGLVLDLPPTRPS